jgi:phosphoribosylaminoimidazole carboxylase
LNSKARSLCYVIFPGGGQLGRMLAASASLLNIKVIILDEGPNFPAKQIVAHSDHIDGSFKDPDKILELARKVDVLTVEIEHVDVGALEKVQQIRNIPIYPKPFTIRTIQDKYFQKSHLKGSGCPIAPFRQVESTIESVLEAVQEFGLPLMLKSRTLAYDGRGNYVIEGTADIPKALTALRDRPLYAEKWIFFDKEIAVMVVQSITGEVRSYPVVETIHKDNICHLVLVPLRSRDATLCTRAQKVAENAIGKSFGPGIYGVEMFLMADGTHRRISWELFVLILPFPGTIFVNEIAPRPHNSGHYTIEACETSQYENHLRAILSLPLGSTALKVPSAAMLNLIGTSSSMEELITFSKFALTVPGTTIHLYGKAECRKGRKMGHVTVVADSDSELRNRLRSLLLELSSDTKEKVDLYAPLQPAPGSGKSSQFPLVGIIMGSDSDLPVMISAARILDNFRIPYELTIVSAHRTPARLTEYAKSAVSRGLRTIIAGAGGAAHLPGMVAAMTALPVIGVPVKGSTLDGVDSLYSIVQMPVRQFTVPILLSAC